LGLHSYDPTGARPGLFWWTRIPDESVTVHLGAGEAVMDLRNVTLFDWSTVPNSLNPAHPLGFASATMDLKIEWSGVKRRVHVSDSANGFAGDFLETSTAIVTATARTPSQHYELRTNPASTVTHFAEVGHDHNGSFFPGE